MNLLIDLVLPAVGGTRTDGHVERSRDIAGDSEHLEKFVNYTG